MDDDEDDDAVEESVDAESLVAELISWCVGVAFDASADVVPTASAEPDPFDPLPTHSPAMGLGQDVIFRWCHGRHTTDDPRSAHDLGRRVRAVFDYLADSNVLDIHTFEEAA